MLSILLFREPWKIFLEKEKMLVTSISSFSLNVFRGIKDKSYHKSGLVWVVQ